MANKSKFFRVFTEGDTCDGRVVERQWIEDIVATYNTVTYSARVWLEHFRSLLPDSPFRAYGDVLAVKAEEIDLPGFGKRLALFAQIDPTSDLVAMNKQRQKLFTSAEIQPNFANTGKCYLMGLAVTDSPASLGTEMLEFSAQAKENPLAARKQAPDNLFTAAQEVAFEFEEESGPSLGEQLFAKVKALLVGEKDVDARFADQAQAVEAIAQSQSDMLKVFGDMNTVVKQLEQQVGDLGTSAKQNAEAIEAHKAAFSALETRLGGEQETATRPPAAGGDGMIKTDC